MSQTAYPHTEAAYWLIRADDAFSVEVITPWDHPITVSPLPLQATLRRGSPSTDGGHSSKARRAIQLTAAPRRFQRACQAGGRGARKGACYRRHPQHCRERPPPIGSVSHQCL
jgi:hypothetical protein